MTGGVRQVDLETVRLLENMQSRLKAAQEPNQVRCGMAEDSRCEFTLLCDKLRPNRNAEVLYRNSEGKVLVNLPLIGLRNAVDQCRNSVSDKEAKDPIKILDDQMRDYAMRRKQFLDSIEKNGEQAAYFKIEKAMVELSLADEKPKAFFIDPSEVEKQIRLAEEKTGVKLSEESRKLWGAVNIPTINKQKPATDQNPFFDGMLLQIPDAAGGEEKVRENQKKFQAELTRTYNLFLDAKKDVITVLKKRKNGSNDDEIENLIQRIETIKYMEPKVESLFAGSCGSPNAYYNPFNHEFTICPQMLQSPDATLQMIITHELGHSIDPCIASYSLQQHTGEKKRNPQGDVMRESMNVFLKQMKAVEFNPKIPKQSEVMYSSFDPEMVAQVYGSGLNNHQSREVLAGVPLSKNPFASVVTCLQSGRSVSARMGDIEGAKRNVLENIKTLKESGAPDSHPQVQSLKATLARLDSHYVEKKSCGYMGSDKGPSQMQEAFSDWIASEVMAGKVEAANKMGDREKAKQIAFEANGFFASMNCESFKLDIAEEVQQVMTRAGCQRRGTTLVEDLTNMSRHEDPHPEGHARVSRIFMGHPTISETLGCKQPFLGGAKRCE